MTNSELDVLIAILTVAMMPFLVLLGMWLGFRKRRKSAISAGKRPPTANELARELCLAQVWKRTSDGRTLTHEPPEEGK